MQDVVTETARRLSVGGFWTASEAEEFAVGRLTTYSDEVQVETSFADGYLTTVIRAPAHDLSGGIGIFSNLMNVEISVISTQMQEV